MENVTQPVSSAGSSETISEADYKGSFSDHLDQQRSLVKQKELELKEMQEQIESYNKMVKQLTSQREIAVKKLSDMDIQIQGLSRMLETERQQVEVKDQELKSKRTQLQTLKNEEDELKEKFNTSKQELTSTSDNLGNMKLNETQIRTKLTELKQFLNTTTEAIDDLEKAISYKDTIKLGALCDQMLSPPPLSVNALLTNGIRQQSNNSPLPDGRPHQTSSNFNDPMFDTSANFDPFADDDPFEGDDPFKSEDANLALPEDDPFNPISSATVGGAFLPSNDPFAP